MNNIRTRQNDPSNNTAPRPDSPVSSLKEPIQAVTDDSLQDFYKITTLEESLFIKSLGFASLIERELKNREEIAARPEAIMEDAKYCYNESSIYNKNNSEFSNNTQIDGTTCSNNANTNFQSEELSRIISTRSEKEENEEKKENDENLEKNKKINNYLDQTLPKQRILISQNLLQNEYHAYNDINNDDSDANSLFSSQNNEFDMNQNNVSEKDDEDNIIIDEKNLSETVNESENFSGTLTEEENMVEDASASITENENDENNNKHNHDKINFKGNNKKGNYINNKDNKNNIDISDNVDNIDDNKEEKDGIDNIENKDDEHELIEKEGNEIEENKDDDNKENKSNENKKHFFKSRVKRTPQVRCICNDDDSPLFPGHDLVECCKCKCSCHQDCLANIGITSFTRLVCPFCLVQTTGEDLFGQLRSHLDIINKKFLNVEGMIEGAVKVENEFFSKKQQDDLQKNTAKSTKVSTKSNNKPNKTVNNNNNKNNNKNNKSAENKSSSTFYDRFEYQKKINDILFESASFIESFIDLNSINLNQIYRYPEFQVFSDFEEVSDDEIDDKINDLNISRNAGKSKLENKQKKEVKDKTEEKDKNVKGRKSAKDNKLIKNGKNVKNTKGNVNNKNSKNVNNKDSKIVNNKNVKIDKRFKRGKAKMKEEKPIEEEEVIEEEEEEEEEESNEEEEIEEEEEEEEEEVVEESDNQ